MHTHTQIQTHHLLLYLLQAELAALLLLLQEGSGLRLDAAGQKAQLKKFLFCKTELYFTSTLLALIDKRCQPAVEDWEPWRARVQEEAWSRLVQIDWRDPNLVKGSAGISVSLLVSTIPLIFKASAVCRKLCSRFCGTDTVPWYMYVTRASRTLEEKIR